MKKIKIIYWTIMALFTFSILGSAIPSALSLPYAVEHFTKILGYPAYFLPFTGVTKLLGLVALYIPGYPRIKEWVYAGFTFDLTAAIYSGICVGGATGYLLPPFIALVLLIGSYILYHRILKNREYRVNNVSLANS
ncbi:MAG TPA: DoxX family protein [Flavipsychrobacter sp.]|nr:DoxX family protein [Flavipsychrobacter sp.]